MPIGRTGRQDLHSDRRRRVLIVDDELLVARSFTRILERDHDVTALSSPKEALRLAEAGESWDAILCDLHMPELDGMVFYECLSRSRPELAQRLAFITGGAFTPRAKAFLESTTRPTIEKPLHPDALRALVARMAP